MPQPRALGAAKLSVYGDAQGKTRLRDLRQSGSLKLVFPRTHRHDAEAIMVNTAGGITGGDQFALDVTVAQGARVLPSCCWPIVKHWQPLDHTAISAV
jgi:urease accessory protein